MMTPQVSGVRGGSTKRGCYASEEDGKDRAQRRMFDRIGRMVEGIE